MDLQLKDKRALVTGASRGLGYAAALALAREGCLVALNSRDESKVTAAAKALTKETGVKSFGFPGDVTLPSTAEDLIKKVTASLGGLDILTADVLRDVHQHLIGGGAVVHFYIGTHDLFLHVVGFEPSGGD